MNSIELVIWDWNGTLLNDTDLCIRSINHMLKKRDLPELSKERYLEVFTFPVINYYRLIGFDFDAEPWDPAAMEFINLYLAGLPECRLSDGAVEMLEFFRMKGMKQVIISAMQHEALTESVNALGIGQYFDYIGGIGDHYGGGKIENAQGYLRNYPIPPEKVMLLGDTLHDSEVAWELNCNCILVAAGHQSHERLTSTGRGVVNSLKELKEFF